uniref:Transmembrane 9 superfamily member n=1 Tax=Rhizophora mucronata TaxID=61149 RepID=A0A2P2J9D5_RHIMU
MNNLILVISDSYNLVCVEHMLATITVLIRMKLTNKAP